MPDANDACPFCNIVEAGDFAWENGSAVAFGDGFPVSPGHTLVIPRANVESAFSLDPAALEDLWRLVAEVRAALADDHAPDGFNIGVNDGAAAGQTVGHAHVHVIPRYSSDVDDPRGGVRWVKGSAARYWDS